MKPSRAHDLSLTYTPQDVVPADVLYVTECSSWGKQGYKKVAAAFPSVAPVYWSHGMPKPDLSGWHGDWIISFKADLILPRATLERAKSGAINFHPSSPKYRGLGGYWWALYNGDESFGVTAHHMDERIDHGEIIKTNSFRIMPSETEESLKERTAIHALTLLGEIIDAILSREPLEPCGAKWGAHLYTQKELVLAKDMRTTAAKRALRALESIHGETINKPQKKSA